LALEKLDMDSVLSYAASSASAMLSMALFCAIGMVFGVVPRPRGLLTNETTRAFSQSVFYIFTPALLISTFGAKLSAETLTESGGILLWSALHLVVCALVGWLAVRFLHTPAPHFRQTFLNSITYGNSGSVPLLMLAALSKSPQLAADPGALDRGTVYIFLYMLPFNVVFWGVGLMSMQREADALAAAAELEASAAAAKAAAHAASDPASPLAATANAVSVVAHAAPSSGPDDVPRDAPPALATARALHFLLHAGVSRRAILALAPHLGVPAAALAAPPGRAAAVVARVGVAVRKAFFTPPVIGIAIGVAIGLTPPLRTALFTRGGVLQVLGDVITLLGTPSIPLSNLLLAASLYHGVVDILEMRRAAAEARARRRAKEDAARAAAEAAATRGTASASAPPPAPGAGTIEVEATIVPLSRGTSASAASDLAAAAASVPPPSSPSSFLPLPAPRRASRSSSTESSGGLTRTYSIRIHRQPQLGAVDGSQGRPRTSSTSTGSPDAAASSSLSSPDSFSATATPRLEVMGSWASGAPGPAAGAPEPRLRSRTGSSLSVSSAASSVGGAGGRPPAALPPIRSSLGVVHRMPAIASVTDLEAMAAIAAAAGDGSDAEDDEEDTRGIAEDEEGEGRDDDLDAGERTPSLGKPQLSSLSPRLERPLSGQGVGAGAGVSAGAGVGVSAPLADSLQGDGDGDVWGAEAVPEEGGWGPEDDAAPDDDHGLPADARRMLEGLDVEALLALAQSQADSQAAALQREKRQQAERAAAAADGGEVGRSTSIRLRRPRLSSSYIQRSVSMALADAHAHDVEDVVHHRRPRAGSAMAVGAGTSPEVEAWPEEGAAAAGEEQPGRQGRARLPFHAPAWGDMMQGALPHVPHPRWRPTGGGLGAVLRAAKRPLAAAAAPVTVVLGGGNGLVAVVLRRVRRDGATASGGADNAGQGRGDDDDEEEDDEEEDVPHFPLNFATAGLLIFLRLIVCPAVLFGLFLAAEAARVPVLAPGPGVADNVLRLVVLVQASVPSAQSVLLLCESVQNVRASKELSLIYIAMYGLSVITLACWVTVGMLVIFG
jgi:predicted permease